MNPTLSTDGLWLRLTGVVVIIACLLIYEPGLSGVWQELTLPLLMALGAWWLVKNLAAVAFGVLVLATIHSNLDATSWIERGAYPLLALVSAGMLLRIGMRRFRLRVAATHDARWANRSTTPASRED